MTGAWALFVTASSPVAQACLLAAAGAAMAWQGALDDVGCSVLARLCFYLFTPALSFSTLAAAVSLDSIRHLWPLLANMGVSSCVGLGVGWVLARALGVPPAYRPIIITAVAFGNVGNLPLVFVTALCGDQGAVFARTLGDDCERLGVAYTAFNICAATAFQFTLALYLLRPKVMMAEGNVGADTGGAGDALQLHKDPTVSDLLQGRSPPASPSDLSPGQGGLREVELAAVGPDDASAQSLLPRHHSSVTYPEPSPVPPSTPLRRAWAWVRAVEWQRLFPLPAQAAAAGVAVGCIAPVKALLFGPAPPLRSLAEALRLLAQGLIPSAIPLLGAVLWRGPGRSRLAPRVTVAVVATRLVALPAAMTGLVVGALAAGGFDPPDPMFLLTLLLSNATPTAINMQTITVLYGFGAEEMSQLLFFEYLASLVTLPACVWVFLQIIHAYQGDALAAAPPL